jgi:hypothetical protein
MAIPTGSGTEVLRRGAVITQSSDVTSFKFDGTNPTTGTETYAVPANHIITIISIIICEAGGQIETVTISIDDGTNPYVRILEQLPLAAKATKEKNDKFAVIGGDKIKVWATAGDVDIYYSYLDQDWS